MFVSQHFALAWVIWTSLLVVAGVLSGLGCEGGDCRQGEPSPWEPWTWNEYQDSPASLYAAAFAWTCAIAFAVLVWRRRLTAAAVALAVSAAVAIYPFFAAFTDEGQIVFGPVFLGLIVFAVSLFRSTT